MLYHRAYISCLKGPLLIGACLICRLSSFAIQYRTVRLTFHLTFRVLLLFSTVFICARLLRSLLKLSLSSLILKQQSKHTILAYDKVLIIWISDMPSA